MSSERNIIKVYFKGTHLIYSKPQYQYNHGIILHFADLNLPQAFEAHFANKQNGISKTMIGSENKVEIPDEYFWTGANEIFTWVYLHSDVTDAETVYEVRIPLIKRAKPSDEEPTPEQQSAIDRAIAELNHAVEQTSADAEQTSADREAVTALRDEVIDLKDEAEQSAQTATAKANEASESANSASESEQNAHDYADDAKRYAENAFSSKEIAVASASDAEQAKEDAEQARDDAQDARSDTIQLKQDVVGLKDDVTNLKDDVVNLKDDVIDLKEQTDTNVTHYPKIVDEYWYVWDATQNDFVNTGVDAEGEKGEKGDKGDTGNSGVYIGTEEPTDEEIGVWIDTDGQPDIPSGDNAFVITFTAPSGINPVNPTHFDVTADKTMEEIISAYNSGKRLVGTLHVTIDDNTEMTSYYNNSGVNIISIDGNTVYTCVFTENVLSYYGRYENGISCIQIVGGTTEQGSIIECRYFGYTQSEIHIATEYNDGLMSAMDKQHLDEIYSALKASGVI